MKSVVICHSRNRKLTQCISLDSVHEGYILRGEVAKSNPFTICCILTKLLSLSKGFQLYTDCVAFLFPTPSPSLSSPNPTHDLFHLQQCKISFIVFLINFYQLLSCVRLCDPMDCSTPGFPVLHHLWEFA